MTDHYLAFIGTYTTGDSEGIYTYRFDAGTGALERLSVIGGISNPSWVEVSPSGRYLYAVGEESHGVIKAYAIDPATGALTYLNEQLTGGQVPCHISVDPTESYALLANYGSGSVAMLPIQADGSLAPLTGFVQHQGSSIHPVRQTGPHAHSIILDAANGRAFAPDLGIDKLLVYDLDLDNGTLAPHHVPWVRTPAGAGPATLRHPPQRPIRLPHQRTGVLHHRPALLRGPWCVRRNRDRQHPARRLRRRNHLRRHPRRALGQVRLRLQPRPRQHRHVRHRPGHRPPHQPWPRIHPGPTPRNFAIDPSGTWLLAANQDTSTIVTFRIHPQTGHLHPTGQVTNIPNPVCIKLLPV